MSVAELPYAVRSKSLDRRTVLTGGYGKVVSGLLLSLLFPCLKKLQVDDVDVVLPVFIPFPASAGSVANGKIDS